MPELPNQRHPTKATVPEGPPQPLPVPQGAGIPSTRGTDCGEPFSCPGERVIDQLEVTTLQPDDFLLIDSEDRGTRKINSDNVLSWLVDSTDPVLLSEHLLNIQSDSNGRFAVIEQDLSGFITDASLYVAGEKATAGVIKQGNSIVFRFGNGDLTDAKAILYRKPLS